MHVKCSMILQQRRYDTRGYIQDCRWWPSVYILAPEHLLRHVAHAVTDQCKSGWFPGNEKYLTLRRKCHTEQFSSLAESEVVEIIMNEETSSKWFTVSVSCACGVHWAMKKYFWRFPKYNPSIYLIRIICLLLLGTNFRIKFQFNNVSKFETYTCWKLWFINNCIHENPTDISINLSLFISLARGCVFALYIRYPKLM